MRSDSSGSTLLRSAKIDGDQTGTFFLQEHQKLQIASPSETYIPFHLKAYKVSNMLEYERLNKEQNLFSLYNDLLSNRKSY